jgi:hypothetical protein
VTARPATSDTPVREGRHRGLLQLHHGTRVLLDLLDREGGGRARPTTMTAETNSRGARGRGLLEEERASELADKRQGGGGFYSDACTRPM